MNMHICLLRHVKHVVKFCNTLVTALSSFFKTCPALGTACQLVNLFPLQGSIVPLLETGPAFCVASHEGIAELLQLYNSKTRGKGRE
jgi:hypothetical protein